MLIGSIYVDFDILDQILAHFWFFPFDSLAQQINPLEAGNPGHGAHQIASGLYQFLLEFA